LETAWNTGALGEERLGHCLGTLAGLGVRQRTVFVERS